MMSTKTAVLEVYLTLLFLSDHQVYPDVVIGRRCYSWYMTENPVNTVTEKTNIFIYYVWAIDKKIASNEEANNQALRPSAFSQQLSHQFESLGQKPMLSIDVDETSNILDPAINFNSEMGVWVITFKKLDLYRHMGRTLLITGKEIGLYDCSIGNTFRSVKSLSQIRFDSGPVQVKNGIAGKKFIVEGCDGRTYLVLANDGVYVSQDSLSTIQKLTLPVFGSKAVTLLGASIVLITYDTVSLCLILASDQGLVVLTSDSYGTQQIKTRIIEKPEVQGITGVASSLWMCDFRSKKRQEMPIVLWSEKKLLKTNIKFESFIEFEVPSSMKITDVEFTGHGPRFVAVLLDSDLNKVVFWRINHESAETFQFSPSPVGTSKYTITAALAGIPAIYIWNGLSVFYFYGTDPIQNGELLDQKGNRIGSEADPITQMVINTKAEVLICLKSGIVYYSRVMLLKAWQINTGLSLASSFLSFDQHGQAVLVKVSSDQITESSINLTAKTIQDNYPQLQCPYRDFTTSEKHSVNMYRLDFNDNFVIQTAITLKQDSQEDKIKMQTDRESLITIQTFTDHQQDENDFSQSTRVNFSADVPVVNFNPKGDTFVGRVGFQIRPDFDDDGLVVCPSPGNMMGFVYVGCTGFKYLTIKRKFLSKENEADCKKYAKKDLKPYEYSLEGAQIMYPNGTRGQKKIRVEYDYKTLGCPMKVDFTDDFYPNLTLIHEKDMKVTEELLVGVEFVVYERHNRFFEYSSTTSKVGCLRQVQSWKMMSSSTNETDRDFMWTQANYKECFIDDGSVKLADLTDDPYEILNGTETASAITFKHKHSFGIYVFTAVVVDQEFSFCRFNVTFAVDVVGKFVRKDWLALYIALGIFFGTSIVCFFATYFYFRNYVYGK